MTADLERTGTTTMDHASDLGGKLPRLDSNQQPFGELRRTDHGRHRPPGLHVRPTPADHNRHRPIGFSDGKVTADLGPVGNGMNQDPRRSPTRRGWLAALAFLAVVAAVIIVGNIGRDMMESGRVLPAWLWLGCWVTLIGCGCWAWCRADRRRG